MKFTSESSPPAPLKDLGMPAGKWLISKGGGTDPRWRGDGKELFYVASDGKLMSVDISAKPVFEAGAPRPLFQLPPGFIGGDVTRRRQTFSHRRACGAKRFRTLYGRAELADDLEEISPAICRQAFSTKRQVAGGPITLRLDFHRKTFHLDE